MIHKRFTLILLIGTAVVLLCSGCHHQSSGDKSSGKTKSSHGKQTDHNQSKEGSKKNGTVISMKKIRGEDIPPALQAYRMFYWSAGTKTEAYVAIPKMKGTYDLFVRSHGGWLMANKDKTHVKEIGGHLINKQLLGIAQRTNITLVPMYRGYGHSDGHVNGIAENAFDTNNAIKAIKNVIHSQKQYNQYNIQKGRIRLYGGSMGGGVVLKLAAQRDDIHYVVALSPFVGWDIVGKYDKSHKKWNDYINAAEDAYGSFNPNKSVYKKQSIDYKKIKVPTLLIQGDQDSEIPWKTVKRFYKKMNSNDQNVTFKLVHGGNHGLQNKLRKKNMIIYHWLQNK